MTTKLITAVFLLSTFAAADSIDLTSGSVNFNLDLSGYVGGYIDFSFTNGSSSLSGLSTVGSICAFSSGTCDASAGVYGGTNGAQFFVGGLTLSVASVSLPSIGSTFTAATTLLFDGTFNTCPTADGSGCSGPIDPNVFSVKGFGVASLFFVDLGNSVWQLQSATFTLDPPPVPEPSSLLLLATGLIAVARKLRRA